MTAFVRRVAPTSIAAGFAWLAFIGGCSYQDPAATNTVEDSPPVTAAEVGETTNKEMDRVNDIELATFGGGCFWCTEAVFQQLKGVEKVVSGYMGGQTENPTYQQICRGDTGHAEVIQIEFRPSEVSYDSLLEVFWKTHDPTTLNRQGPDVGTQYRSVVFYHNEKQKALAEKYLQALDESDAFDRPIVTEISPAETFYAAEEYHQDYFDRNPGDRYCTAMIPPKLAKLKKVFADRLKTGAEK